MNKNYIPGFLRLEIEPNSFLRLGRTIFALLVAGVLLPKEAHGAAIQGVTISAVSSEYVSLPDARRATSLVTNSGLYGDYHTVSPRGSFWLSSPTTAGAYSNAFVTFDLGSVQPVHQMKVWNYNEGGVNTRRGIQTAHIAVAGEDLVFTTNLFNQSFNRAPGVFTNNFAQFIDLGGVQARYIRINVVTNFGGDNRVGLSKVRFINTNTPPTIKLVTKNFSGDRVMVQFSEPVSPSSATNPANYSIQSGSVPASISSVVLNSFNDRAFLQTSTLNSNLVYTLAAQNVREATDSISITNTAVTIEPELVLWLKADQGVVADESGFVSQWADQSGAGNNAVNEPDPSSQPVLVNSVLNGKPVIRFDGVNDGLLSPHSPSLIAEGDISFFAVITPQSFVGYNGILSKSGSIVTNYPAPFDFELAITTGKPRLLRGNGGSISTLNGTSNAVAGQTYIVEIVVQGTNATHYLNGYFNGTATFADGIEDQGNPVRIGHREDNNLYVNGDIAEIILVRGAVTEGERLGIDDYLGRKYGIATANIGAPVIASQPANATNYVGENAAFSVGVTNGALPRTLQWYQTPNILLAGETNVSLVLSNVVLAQDNTSYYLVASNADGSVQTDSATLTVLPLTPPYITTQPQSQTVYVHQSVTFSVNALGSRNLIYQWSYNNAAIEGAASSTLTVANVSTNYAGNYSVTVSNEFAPAANSSPAVLTVVTPATESYPAAVLEANPLIYYRFSDINDTNVTFNFGKLGATHNGSYLGSYTAASGPLPPFPFEADNAAYKDETLTAGGVQIPAFNLTTNAGARFTFAAWVYKDYLQSSFASAFFSRQTGQSCGLGVKLVSGQDMLEYHWNDGQSTYNSGLIVPNSQWTFVAMVVEPTKATLYMNAGNGLQSATNAVAHAVRPVMNSGYIGWDPFNANRRWYGTIDETMFFDRALSAAEIGALYSGTAMTPAPSVQLNVSQSDGNLIFSWTDGTLQRADTVTGLYSDLLGITSPYTVPANGSAKFYRVRVQ